MEAKSHFSPLGWQKGKDGKSGVVIIGRWALEAKMGLISGSSYHFPVV